MGPPEMPPPPPLMSPPPGYVGYGDVGAMSPFQRIGGITKWLVIALAVMVPVQVLGIVSLLGFRDDAQSFLDGEMSEDAFTNSLGSNLASLLSLVLTITIAVLTILMMYRMAQNLQRLGRTGATWGPAWAIGGWFLPPCAIYVLPWLMFRELWRGSDPAVAPGDPSWKTGRTNPLFDLWWVLYGLVPVAGFVTSAGVFTNFQDIDAEALAERLVDYATINLVLSVVGIATTVVYLTAVRQLSQRHMAATREA